MVALVRNALLAVDQANKTGNYTVLRDLAGPQFRERNNAARLAQIFGSLPAQGIDLLAVAVTEPVFTQGPDITPEQRLRVQGGFQIAPRPVVFELLFEPNGGVWRIYSIAILPA